MLRKWTRKYKAVLLAWIMLLSFLPQVLVKGFHQHTPSWSAPSCEMVSRAQACSGALPHGGKSSAEEREKQSQERHTQQQRRQQASHQKKTPSDDGKNDSGNGHDCAICHYLISPFVPPTFTHFSFYAPDVHVEYLPSASAVRVVALATPLLRGPPQI